MYKAIFLDMDGTLLNSYKEVSTRTIETLKKIKESGIEIILISGRCNKSIEYIVKNRINTKHQIIRYIISTDGTMIKDLKEDKIIYQSSLNKNIVEGLIYSSQKFDTAFYVITENNMYKDNRCNKFQKEIDYWYINGEFYGIKNNLETIDFNLFCKNNKKVNRILFFSKNFEKLDEINNEMQKEKNLRTLFEKSYNNYQLLLVSNEYSKEMGVIEMCKYLNIPIEQTIAFGDSDNDIEMLNIVGNGIAMKNAKQNLKCNQITQFTNNEDGVAIHLENMIKNGEIICTN
jgi:hypothetical protein